MATNLNNADIVRELQDKWAEVLVAVMRKYNLKEVEIFPEDLVFMVPPHAETDGKAPALAAIGYRDVLPRGGFKLVLCYGRDEFIDVMAQFQKQNQQTKPKSS